MERTIRYGGLPMWGFPKGSKNIPQRFMNFAARSWILILLQVKNIWSMMGIIIAFLIRIIFYRYWMRFSIRSYGCSTKIFYDTILCSQDLRARILILLGKWRALSGTEDCPCEIFRKAAEIFYSGSWIVLQYWYCCKLRLYYPWWGLLQNCW